MDIQKSESIQKTQIREKDGTASVAMYTPSSTKTMSRIKKKAKTNKSDSRNGDYLQDCYQYQLVASHHLTELAAYSLNISQVGNCTTSPHLQLNMPPKQKNSFMVTRH
jgi:hypothetical protein